jgi:hypothetical protein
MSDDSSCGEPQAPARAVRKPKGSVGSSSKSKLEREAERKRKLPAGAGGV